MGFEDNQHSYVPNWEVEYEKDINVGDGDGDGKWMCS